ncbi:MAG TPA: nickel pincer cofactor biosynthesis protein LarC [Verrucomicrobiae bacterium]|nr:nickel pincer cofactor biosynthesis protein LarC [Verrucomicrobiae bacterium]
MKTLYLDIFSGVSGDMFIGALLDLGVDYGRFEQELRRLGLDEFHLHVSRQQRAHIAGTKFDVELEHEDHEHHGGHHGHEEQEGHGQHGQHEQHEHHGHGEHRHAEHSHAHAHAAGADGHGDAHADEHDHGHGQEHEHEHEHGHGRTFAEIRDLITRSRLSDWVKQKAIAVFQRVANAEGKIHGYPAEQVHFHEVGAVDSIVDIVGACVGLELLDRPRVLAGPVVEGTGWVHCAHGRFPLPAPATLEILAERGVSITQCAEPHELVTPTGAALLAEFAEGFGPMQGLKLLRVGYGLGSRDNQTRPNVLRAVLAEAGAEVHDWERDTVTVLETNLDDTNAEWLGNLAEQALAQGALDVVCTPAQMKKNRPGVLLTILCADAQADQFCALILRETTAFGVRRHQVERRKLRREQITVETPYGPVEVKLGRLDGQVVQAAPEYESCRRIAEQKRVPLKSVYEAALRNAPQPATRN